MPIIIYNEGWMLYNSYLALIAVALGFAFFNINGRILKYLFGFLWLIYLPNTIYIFTDLEHLIYQWNSVQPQLHVLLLTQYIILEIVGVITFLCAFLPFEKIINSKYHSRKRKIELIIAFNFLIAFGMVLGRVERINSWEIFTAPFQVTTSIVHILTSFDLIVLTILFGLLCNFIYFLFRNQLIRVAESVYHILD